jgi:RHS repeat-associated protein
MNNYLTMYSRAAWVLALMGSTIGHLTAKEQWHVYDPLGNTVASVNADAVVAEIESTAFGESRTPTAGARFTGKPYDADLGAHVFPFRNYRSDSGRWTSADPSGFPDGVNSNRYDPVVTTSLDPLGLTTVNASEVQSMDIYRSDIISAMDIAINNLYSGSNLPLSKAIFSGWAHQRISSQSIFSQQSTLSGTADYVDSSPGWSNPSFQMAEFGQSFAAGIGISYEGVNYGYNGTVEMTVKSFTFSNYSGTEEPPNSWSVEATTNYTVYIKVGMEAKAGVNFSVSTSAGAAGHSYTSTLTFTE